MCGFFSACALTALLALGVEAADTTSPESTSEPTQEPTPEDRPESRQIAPESWPEIQLVDRIVAVVDQDPIFQSEIDRLIELGLAEPREGEEAETLRRRVLDELIDQRLRYRQVGRLGTRTVTVEECESAVAEFRAGCPGREEFQRHLQRPDTTPSELRQIVARQLAVVDYVDRRLGPRVFISLEDIQRYYEDELVPALRALGSEPPPLDEVRETIREVLRERRLNEEIEAWTKKLRREADVQILIDDYPDELPPLRRRIETPLEDREGEGWR